MRIRDGCEWNPAANTESCGADEHYLSADATVSVGVSTNWHLCASCAALPKFNRYKKTPLKQMKAPADE